MGTFIKSGIKAKAPAHLGKFLSELGAIEGVVTCYHVANSDSVVIKTNVLWDEEVFDDFFLNYDDEDLFSDALSEYLKHESNGKEYFRNIRARTVERIAKGELEIADATFLESKLKDVKAQIMSGDWSTGLATLMPIVVDGAFTQETKDELVNYILNYIQNEYVLLRP